MKMEVCENCGAEIGQLEQVFVYENHIICTKCYTKLKGDLIAREVKKPGKVTAIGGMRLGAGICNIIAGIVFCWLLFPIVMIPLGIVEILSASNLLKAQPRQPSGLKTIAIFEIVAIITLAGWISVVVGILTLVFLADSKVKNYVNSLLPG
jgi:ABC-type phosphate transport system permease subunit